jgi:fucokinase
MIFDFIVITAPSEYQRRAYSSICASLQSSDPVFYSSTRFVCVSDPGGERIGSGGGTINALDVLLQSEGDDILPTSRVLIIHSGGDSRRCPLHSVCGKAWATINAPLQQHMRGGSNMWASPMTLLIREISSFCAGLALGSVAVASGDVMLHLQEVSW